MWYAILILIILILIYTNYNVYQKYIKSTDANYEMYDHIVHLNKFVGELYADITNILKRIRKIDHKQIFEKDDEVGIVFERIKETIERLNKFITKNEHDEKK